MEWIKEQVGPDRDTSGSDSAVADFATYYATAAGDQLMRVIEVEWFPVLGEPFSADSFTVNGEGERGYYALAEWHNVEYAGGDAEYVLMDPPGRANRFYSLHDAVKEAERLSGEDIAANLGGAA